MSVLVEIRHYYFPIRILCLTETGDVLMNWIVLILKCCHDSSQDPIVFSYYSPQVMNPNMWVCYHHHTWICSTYGMTCKVLFRPDFNYWMSEGFQILRTLVIKFITLLSIEFGAFIETISFWLCSIGMLKRTEPDDKVMIRASRIHPKFLHIIHPSLLRLIADLFIGIEVAPNAFVKNASLYVNRIPYTVLSNSKNWLMYVIPSCY